MEPSHLTEEVCCQCWMIDRSVALYGMTDADRKLILLEAAEKSRKLEEEEDRKVELVRMHSELEVRNAAADRHQKDSLHHQGRASEAIDKLLKTRIALEESNAREEKLKRQIEALEKVVLEKEVEAEIADSDDSWKAKQRSVHLCSRVEWSKPSSYTRVLCGSSFSRRIDTLQHLTVVASVSYTVANCTECLEKRLSFKGELF